MKHAPTSSNRNELHELGLSEDLVHSLRHMVESERSASMLSMPTERVLRAVRAAGVQPGRVEEFLERELLSWFRPVFVAGVLIIIALAAYNVELSRSNDYEQSATEMVLGLQPVTVVVAYDIDFDHH
jgi:hypothetical protein